MNCFRFVDDIHNTTIINIFNSDNSNIASVKIKNCQIMAIITYMILKFEYAIKRPYIICCYYS